MPGLGQESLDLAQEVLIVVARGVPQFDRKREGSFRAWLRQITVNQIRNYRRKRHRKPVVDPLDGFLDQIADLQGELARKWDQDHDKHVVDVLLAAVRVDFSEVTWEAFRRFGLDGEPARTVAEALGPSESAVILAKTRVLKRLRREAGDLLE